MSYPLNNNFNQNANSLFQFLQSGSAHIIGNNSDLDSQSKAVSSAASSTFTMALRSRANTTSSAVSFNSSTTHSRMMEVPDLHTDSPHTESEESSFSTSTSSSQRMALRKTRQPSTKYSDFSLPLPSVKKPKEESPKLTVSSSSSKLSDTPRIRKPSKKLLEALGDSSSSSSITTLLSRREAPAVDNEPKAKKEKTGGVIPVPNSFRLSNSRPKTLSHAGVIQKIFNGRNDNYIKSIEQAEIDSNREALLQDGLPHGLKLCQINGDVGNGVFLDPKAAPIQPGVFLGFYTGEWIISKHEEEHYSNYIMTVLDNIHLSLDDQGQINEKNPKKSNAYFLDIDGRKEGNYTRNFNHSEKDDNVEIRIVRLPNGTIECAFYSSKVINPGEQVLLDYGKEYWKVLKELFGVKVKPMKPKTYLLNADNQIVKSNGKR
ncbi:MAG: SET domain-containing protein-lysine N-methyltransferase [Verrucomicrobia bacterium]|nr:SET domain-containing protein-lysine N-methyltransferase [Verrucomicrobiota bacterium]